MAGNVIGTATINVVAATKDFTNGIKGLGGKFAGALGKIGGAVSALGLGTLAREAVDVGKTYRIQLDNARASVEGLTGSTAEADDLMRRMVDFAIKTPFDLPGVQNVTTRLLAVGKGFGVTSDNVIGFATTLGNAAAINGKNADSMLNVVNVLGKISGQGRVTTRDMNQLTANFPSLHPWEVLAELTGKTEAELRDLAKQPGGLSGIATSTEVINAMTDAMAELPGAADAMQRRMATLGGTMELFKDTIGVALADGLKPFFEALQKLMTDPAILSFLQLLIEQFGAVATVLINAVIPQLPALIDLLNGLVSVFTPLLPLVALFADTIGTAAGALAGLAPVFTAIVTVIADVLAQVFPIIQTAILQLAPVFSTLLTALVPIISILGGAFVQILATLMPVITSLASVLGGVLVSAMEALTPIIQIIAEAFVTLAPFIGRLAKMIGNLLARNLESLLPPLIEVAETILGALLPVLPLLANTFLKLLGAITPILPMFAKLIGSVLTKLAPLLPPIIEAVVGLAVALGDGLAQILEALLPLLLQVAGTLLTALAPILPKIAELILALVAALMPLIPPLVQLITALLPPIAAQMNIVATVVGFLATLIADVLVWALELLMSIMSKVYLIILTVANVLASTLKPAMDTIAKFINNTVVPAFKTMWAFISEKVIAIINKVSETFNKVKDAVGTAVTGIVNFVLGIAGRISSAVSVLWEPLKRGITIAKDWVGDKIDAVVDFATKLPGRISGVFSGMWDGIKTAFRAAINFVIRGWNSLHFSVPSISAFGITVGGFSVGVPQIKPLARGAIVDHPTFAQIGERGPEAVIPLTNPMRAMQLMQASGLDRLASRMGGDRQVGPLITMPGAIIQDATDADLVAQRTLVAMRAAMLV